METKTLFYLVLSLVIIFILFSEKLTEKFTNSTIVTIDEFTLVLQLLKPHIEQFYNEINTSDVLNLIKIYKESQTKSLENRATYFNNATTQIKFKDIELSELYWELRTLITEDDVEINKSIVNFIITERLIKKIKESKLLPESISIKLQNKVPRQMILFIVKHYDPNNKTLDVKIEDFLEKVQNNPSFLD